tara:strand:+ start:2339 stop:2749 length:411 start_codon:yes stop_codon:yes gene_type:complete
MSTIKATAAVLTDYSSKKTLLSLRPHNKPLGGFWEFPGGKIEYGETPKDALCRECYEELGILISPKDLLFLKEIDILYSKNKVNILFFQVMRWDQRPQPKEGQKLAWHTKETVKNLKTLPRVKEILNAIQFEEEKL